MALTYALIALGLVVTALVGLALAVIGVGVWIRWLRAAGTAAVVVALGLTGAAALNTLVPRGCDDGLDRPVAAVQRPLVAAVDGTGACHRLGLAQVGLVPLVGVVTSLAITVRPRRPHPRPPGPDRSGQSGAGRGDLGAARAAGPAEPVAERHTSADGPGSSVPEAVGGRWRLGNRPELDGVRGLAVIAVLLGHAGLVGVPKIHIYGVGLFFVLSGFLITALLLEERADTGGIRLRSFYLRRVYRLGPALLVYVAGVAAATWVFGLFERDEVSRGIRHTLLYTMNFAKIDMQDTGPFGHLWSLSVEEHFYLVWPALAVATLALARRHPHRWLAGLAGAGLATSVFLTFTYLDQRAFLRAENSTETRASGLLAGSLLAIAFHRRPSDAAHLDRRAGAVVAVAGLAGLIALSTDRWFGPAGELPVEVAALGLVGALVLAPSACNRALAWAPLARVGRLSYALYLWHYPVFLLVGGELRTLSWWEGLTGSAISLGIAELSMRVVERPFLDRRDRSRRQPTVRPSEHVVGPEQPGRGRPGLVLSGAEPTSR